MLATLNRFISRLADRCRPFYQLLRKWKGFSGLEAVLSVGPYADSPELGEDLFMYLSVSEHAVSVVLLCDQGVQWLMYYISKIMVDTDMRYLPLEKFVLVLVHAIRKMSHYFQAHTVYVLIEYRLQSLLKRYDFTSWIAKWGTRLGSFDIRYRPRSSVKGQVLADFVAEFSPRKEMEVICHMNLHLWKVFVDGESNAVGAGAGIFIITPKGIRLEHSFRLGFKASNNESRVWNLAYRIEGYSGYGCMGSGDLLGFPISC